MQNSWLTNTAKFRRGRLGTTPLHMCEHDAVLRGLFEGDRVRISTEYGSVETEVCINDGLRAGVVAMSHGYGAKEARSLGLASKKPGANCNAVMPIGVGTYEPVSFMSWLSGVPVHVERVGDVPGAGDG
jgi:anaerobic selenocysteine-containing dehydrogenase